MMETIRDVKEHTYGDLQFANVGTEEYERMVDCIIKMERLELDAKKSELEESRMKQQRRRDILDLALKHLTNIGLGVGTIFTTLFIFAQGTYFEKENTFTSTMMRNFMSKNLFKLK